MTTSRRVTAFDSGTRVVVAIEPESTRPVALSIGEGEEHLESLLTVSDAERVIDALGRAIQQLARLRAPDARD